ncbi:MAG: hypothetical protein R2761_31195 [Acidimicrobiales bacterium]
MVLPSLRRPDLEVAVVCDTSGSVSDTQLGLAVDEIDAILRHRNPVDAGGGLRRRGAGRGPGVPGRDVRLAGVAAPISGPASPPPSSSGPDPRSWSC